MRRFDIVIVGGGHAGRRAAEGALAASPALSIAIIGEERHLPYDRPALSKQALEDFSRIGETEKRSASWYAENGIEPILATRVVAIEPLSRTVTTAESETIGWQSLILATGSRARTLDLGIDPKRIHVLRTRDDAERLSGRLCAGRKIGIVGAGFIGLEAAAAASARGCSVDVNEAAGHAMARVLPAFLARTIEARHRQAGVRLHFGAAADHAGLEACDDIVVGVGIIPNTQLAQSADIACDDGILVDAHGRTNLNGVFAAGEVTRHPSWRGDGTQRRESWHVAEHQAYATGRTAAGVATAYADLPWFWSDQYDLNIQVLGDLPADAEFVLRGDPASGQFSAFALRQGIIEGVVAINAGRDIAAARRLIQRGIVPSRQQLADPGIGWNAILAAAA